MNASDTQPAAQLSDLVNEAPAHVMERAGELYDEYSAQQAAELGRSLTAGEALRLTRHAIADALREDRSRRHWDHTGIRPASDRNGQPAAELLFYTSRDNGMVSVLPLTDAELAELIAKGTSYLNAKAIAAAEARTA